LSKKINVSGPSPFGPSSGVFEAEIFITADKPSDDNIDNQTFDSLWKDTFHLTVSNGSFFETLGSDSNPLPDNVFKHDLVWIIVKDQFSASHISFKFSISGKIENKESSNTTSNETKRKERVFLPPKPGPRGYIGQPGEKGRTGTSGVQGDKGDKGDKGNKGPTGDKGDNGDKGSIGDKGVTGPVGDKGKTGETGPHGIQGDKGIQGPTGDKGGKGVTGPIGSKGPQGLQGPLGDKGLTGIPGPHGEKGIRGPLGP